jgi:hypothetical protein
MSLWVKGFTQPKMERYYAIHCFTCHCDVDGKSALRRHKGHDVHYVNAKGEIDE